jgi:hypothetical protein
LSPVQLVWTMAARTVLEGPSSAMTLILSDR